MHYLPPALTGNNKSFPHHERWRPFSREFGWLTLTARIHSSKSQGTLSPITLICQFNKKYIDFSYLPRVRRGGDTNSLGRKGRFEITRVPMEG